MNLGDILFDTAARYPDGCAIRTADQDYSFGQVVSAVTILTKEIKSLSAEKNRIAVLLSNVPAFSVSYFSVLSAGHVVVPLNPLWSDYEIVKILSDCQAKLLIVDSTQCNRGKEILKSPGTSSQLTLLEVKPNPLKEDTELDHKELANLNSKVRASVQSDETAVVLYTSGSTGSPKGVELTHRNMYLNAQSVSQEKFSYGDRYNELGPGHVGLAGLPLSHAFGQTNLQNGVWFSGGAIVYQSRFDAQSTIQLMEESQVTFFAGVPTMYFDLVEAAKQQTPRNLNLTFCVCGGAPLSSRIKEEFKHLFGVPIQESYGLTETSPMISCQKFDRTHKAGCVGRVIEGVEVRLG